MTTDFGGTSQPNRAHWGGPGSATDTKPPLRWLPGLLRAGQQRPAAGPADTLAEGLPVTLRDGSRVLIRQLRGTDAPLLADGFARLSDRSRRMRFLANKPSLSQAELHYLTNVDHHDHEALGAASLDDGRGVGVIRYIRDSEDPQAAEIAITIVDEWQGRGLGTELLALLTHRARRTGVWRFTATVAADNDAMLALLHRAGASLAHRGFGTLEYDIPLVPGSGFALCRGQQAPLGQQGLQGLQGLQGRRGQRSANVA
jgi:RimJ/RimL family protein N-acetyltransferase